MITIAYCLPKPRTGGAELHVLEVLRRLDRGRFRPLVVFLCDGTHEPAYGEFEALGIPIINLNMPSGMLRFENFTKIYQLVKRLREQEVDIVHGYLFDSNLIGVLAGRLAGVPIRISSKRSIDHHGLLRMAACKLTNRLSRRVTAVSEAVADFVRTTEGCPDDKLVVTPNGVDGGLTSANDEQIVALKRQLGIPADALVVGTVAAFLGKKGYRYFVETADKVVRSSPGIYFVAFGDGRLKPRMEVMVERLGLRSHVIFPGCVSAARAKMPMFDIYFCASTIEGMSNALLEAMAERRPVVATDVGGNSENVLDGVTGFLVPSADPAAMAEKILTLADDPSLRARMGEAGRKRVIDDFSMERMVARLEDLYAQLAAEEPQLLIGSCEAR